MTPYINVIPGNTSPIDKDKIIRVDMPEKTQRREKPEKSDKRKKHRHNRRGRKKKEKVPHPVTIDVELKDTDPVKSEVVDCVLSDWTVWSECSTTCGQSYKQKTRMVKREPENNGKKCSKKLHKKKRCNVPKCCK